MKEDQEVEPQNNPPVEPEPEPERTRESLEDEVRQLRREAARNRTERNQVLEELKALRVSMAEEKTARETAQRQAQEAQQMAERQKWISQVASETGIPVMLAERLMGGTYEEIKADAEKLAAALPKPPAGGTPLRPVTSPANPADKTGLTRADLQQMSAEDVAKIPTAELQQILKS